MWPDSIFFFLDRAYVGVDGEKKTEVKTYETI